MTDLKRLQHLVERYGSARAQESIADRLDAPTSTLRRNHEACKTAWDELTSEMEMLLRRGNRVIEIHPAYHRDGAERCSSFHWQLRCTSDVDHSGDHRATDDNCTEYHWPKATP